MAGDEVCCYLCGKKFLPRQKERTCPDCERFEDQAGYVAERQVEEAQLNWSEGRVRRR